MYVNPYLDECLTESYAKPFLISWRGSYGNGGGPRHFNYFQCTGLEPRLSQCGSFNVTEARTYGYDVGIGCRQGQCKSHRICSHFLNIL